MINSDVIEHGQMHFEFGVKPALLIPGRKYYTAIYIDGTYVRSAIVIEADKKKYFKAITQSDTAPRKIAAHVRYMLKKSPITRMKREMNKKTKFILRGILEDLK